MTFKRFLACLILCLLCCIPLVGCGQAKIAAPGKTDAVVGNGSFAVTKGDYLYFTNGFMSLSDITLSNRNNKFVKGALYVTKLVDGELQVDEDGVLNNYEIITTKIAGYENSQLYIFGDYLYFVTPNTDKTITGGLDTGIAVFCRIKLDKSSDLQRVTATKGEDSGYQFEFYHKDSVTYLLIFEDSKLYRVECGKKIGKKTLVAENVASVAMPKRDNYAEQAKLYDKIYFTASLTEDEAKEHSGGNKICAYNIAENKISSPLRIGNATYSVINVVNNFLYFTYTDSEITTAYLYRVELDKIASDATPTQLGYVEYKSYFIFENNLVGCDKILGINDSTVHLITPNVKIPNVILSDNAEVLFIKNSEIFYRTSSNIVKYDVKSQISTNLLNLSDYDILTKDKNDKLKISVDSDGRFLYFNVLLTNKNGTSYYLHRLDMHTHTDYVYKTEFVGVYAEVDIPDEEEE